MKKIKETTIEDFPLQDFATWRVHCVQQIRADKKKKRGEVVEGHSKENLRGT